MNLDPETLFELLDRQLLAPIGTVSSTPALLIEGSDARQGPTESIVGEPFFWAPAPVRANCS
jgi:hypothetical protein